MFIRHLVEWMQKHSVDPLGSRGVEIGLPVFIGLLGCWLQQVDTWWNPDKNPSHVVIGVPVVVLQLSTGL